MDSKKTVRLLLSNAPFLYYILCCRTFTRRLFVVHFGNFVQKVAFLRVVFQIAVLFEFFQFLALLTGDTTGHFHTESDVQIAGNTARCAYAAPAETFYVAVLRAFGHFVDKHAVRRGNFHLATANRSKETDGHSHVQIVIFARENFAGFYRKHQQQTAVAPCFATRSVALARQLQHRAVFYPGRDRNVDDFVFVYNALAGAGFAWIGNYSARAAALIAGAYRYLLTEQR